MDKKKRNILLICAAIFICSYLARSFVINSMRMAYLQQQANRQRRQPAPRPESAAQPPATDAVDPVLASLSGVWEAHGQVPARGVCDLRLELKQNDPGHYTGYSRFSCISLGIPKDANVMATMLPHMNPDAAILTGTVERGAIHLRADKTIGTDVNGCAVSDLTVTPFGASAVAAEWKEGTCQGGNLLMQRQRQ